MGWYDIHFNLFNLSTLQFQITTQQSRGAPWAASASRSVRKLSASGARRPPAAAACCAMPATSTPIAAWRGTTTGQAARYAPAFQHVNSYLIMVVESLDAPQVRHTRQQQPDRSVASPYHRAGRQVCTCASAYAR